MMILLFGHSVLYILYIKNLNIKLKTKDKNKKKKINVEFLQSRLNK